MSSSLFENAVLHIVWHAKCEKSNMEMLKSVQCVQKRKWKLLETNKKPRGRVNNID